MTIVAIAIVQIVATAFCALAVRAQLALFRGFDVMIAAAVTIASELTCALGALYPGWGWYGAAAAMALSSAVTGVVLFGWNRFVAGWMRDSDRKGTALLVMSLFCSTAVSGLVGFVRGPGLVSAPWPDAAVRLPDGSSLNLGTSFACLAGFGLLLAVGAWQRSRAGFALELWSQDRSFASEIGISELDLIGLTAIAVALATSFVGVWSALSNGSTPDVGLSFFLTGAGGALLFSRQRVAFAAFGGALVGLVLFVLQLWLSPPETNMLLFFTIGIFLAVRGSSRAEQSVR